MKKIKSYIELIRVKQWIKNFIIFIPALCASDMSRILAVCIGFFAFSLQASFVYVINDINDIEKDKKHPRKKKRPLPSGRVGKKEAIVVAIVMLISSLALNYVAQMTILNLSWVFLLAYLIINIGYSFGLKNIAILDIALLSAGFVLRVYYGGALAGVGVSNWLFLTILSSSMFLALGKRKKEFCIGSSVRKVLKAYNEPFLDKFSYIFLALTFVFYSMWAREQNNQSVIYTVPIVILIFMRYCLILEKCNEGDPTTIIYKDKLLLFLCGLYGVIMVTIFCL